MKRGRRHEAALYPPGQPLPSIPRKVTLEHPTVRLLLLLLLFQWVKTHEGQLEGEESHNHCKHWTHLDVHKFPVSMHQTESCFRSSTFGGNDETRLHSPSCTCPSYGTKGATDAGAVTHSQGVLRRRWAQSCCVHRSGLPSPLPAPWPTRGAERPGPLPSPAELMGNIQICGGCITSQTPDALLSLHVGYWGGVAKKQQKTQNQCTTHTVFKQPVGLL